MRKEPFVTGEIYHIYNRGTDKRNIILDKNDTNRFIESLLKFNSIEPLGSIYESVHSKKFGHPMSKSIATPLIEFIAFSLNLNHYHFQVKQLVDNGIEKFMQKFGNGYTKYFNNKYQRSGVLFQGKFKSSYVDSDIYLMHLNVYINFNNQLSGVKSSLTLSSLDEYFGLKSIIPCEKSIIMDRFKNIKEYKKFADSALQIIQKNKLLSKALEEDVSELKNEDNPLNIKIWTSDVQRWQKSRKKDIILNNV